MIYRSLGTGYTLILCVFKTQPSYALMGPDRVGWVLSVQGYERACRHPWRNLFGLGMTRYEYFRQHGRKAVMEELYATDVAEVL